MKIQKKPTYFSISSIKKFDSLLKLTPEEIIKNICIEYNISKETILSYDKTRIVSEARHIAMFLCTQLDWGNKDKKQNLYLIAKAFKRKRHSTIVHAKKVVSSLIQTDKEFKQKFMNIIENRFVAKVESVNI